MIEQASGNASGRQAGATSNGRVSKRKARSERCRAWSEVVLARIGFSPLWRLSVATQVRVRTVAGMERRIFGKTGTAVSVLGFGGAPVGLLKTERAEVARILNQLLDAGVNLIDTAASYSGSEELIAEAIGHRRQEYFLVTKCGGKIDDIDAPAWSAGLIAATVDRALRRLRTDRLDLMLLHTCDLETLKRGEGLATLLKARDAGKIRFVGYSGDNEAVAYAASLPEVAVVEMSVNLADQANIDRGVAKARENNVGVIAKRPIANAAWKERAQQPGFYKDYAQTYKDRLDVMRLDPAALEVDSWAELALRFTLSQAGVQSAIIGTTSAANTRANIEAAAKGPLPEHVLAKVRAAFKRADPEGKWRGET